MNESNLIKNKALGPTNIKPGLLGSVFNLFTNINKKAFSVALSYVSPFMMERPVFTDWNTENSVIHGLKVSPIAYRCIMYRASNVGSVPWVVEKKVKGEWKRVADHPLADLIAHPNPQQSRIDLIMRSSMFLDLCGNALLYKNRSRNNVVELSNVQPDRIFPRPDKETFLKDYEFHPSGGGSYEYIQVKDILHWQFPNPVNPYWGLGPLQALGKVVDTEVDAANWQKYSMQNRNIKDGLLTFKRHLTAEQHRKIREEFANQVSGSSNARGPLVLGEDANYTPFSMTPVELDFVNSRKMAKEEICQGFGVPPILVGIGSESYNNADLARIVFWLDYMIPLLDLFAAGFNRSLLPDFEDDETFRVMYDLSQVPQLLDLLDRKATTSRKLFEIGYPSRSINSRLKLGMDAQDGTDVGFIPSNLVPSDFYTNPEKYAGLTTKPSSTGSTPTKDVRKPAISAVIPSQAPTSNGASGSDNSGNSANQNQSHSPASKHFDMLSDSND